MQTIHHEKKWVELTIKEKLSYITSLIMIGSGILLAFLSFFLNAHNIATGVLIYIAQTFLVGGTLIGASIYLKSKWLEYDSRLQDEITKLEHKKDEEKNK